MSFSTTLLIVDDAVIIHQVVRRALRRVRPTAAVVDAVSLVTALQALQQRNITAILTDYHLPDGNGLQLLITARTQFPGIPVACMSSDASVEAAVLAAGADAFLQKPFALDQLQAVLQQLI